MHGMRLRVSTAPFLSRTFSYAHSHGYPFWGKRVFVLRRTECGISPLKGAVAKVVQARSIWSIGHSCRRSVRDILLSRVNAQDSVLNKMLVRYFLLYALSDWSTADGVWDSVIGASIYPLDICCTRDSGSINSGYQPTKTGGR
jgi:hypothetical protein